MKRTSVFLALFVCIASSFTGVELLIADAPAVIYTPRNTQVPDTYTRDEMSQQEMHDCSLYVQVYYPNATILDHPTRTYNCHAYAWHVTEGGGNVWIGKYTTTAEDVYWGDGSYCEVSGESQAEKVNYPEGNHSAITTSTAGTYHSKWGACPLMEHASDYCPYMPSTLKYYTENDDPGADVMGFTVVNGVASWFLESLYRTETLVLEGRRSREDPWVQLPISVPMRVGETKVEVGSTGYNLFRLVETETMGRRLVQGEVRAQTVDPSELAKHPIQQQTAPSLEELKAQVERMKERVLASGRRKIQMASATSSRMVIYTVSQMQTAVTSAIASFWTSAGYQVSVELVDGFPSNPDDFRAALDAAIETEAQSGAGFFLLVGDANDWVEFSQPWPGDWEDIRQARIAAGYPPAGQPEKDIIPTWIIPDPLPRGEGMSYFNPYWFTDQPYADTNGDDIPDVVVSRLPFTTSSEVYAYATKLWDENASWDADRVAFLIGNRIRSDSDGTRARLAAWNVIPSVPDWVDVDSLYWSQCWYDHERNTLPADLINTTEPELVVQIASLSNRYYPGDFFDKTLGYIPWTMGLLTTTQPLVFLSASCGGADYARTEHPTYQLSVPHEFLAESNKGAVAWIGPTAGSWQNGNEVVARTIIEELFEDPERPMGESYNNAIRRVLIQHADVPDIVQTAKAYQFLGDPMVPFLFTDPTPPPPPGGGCPHVYAYDGERFVMDNTILGVVAPDMAGRQEANVSDAYILQHGPALEQGVYRIEIREFEQEHVYLDRVQLCAVDHPDGTDLVVTDDGRLVVHDDWLLPVTARSVSNEDLLGMLSQRDNVMFDGTAGDEVILRYRIPSKSSVGFATMAMKKMMLVPPMPGSEVPAGIEALLRKPGSDEYVSLGSFMPREYLSPHTRIITDRLFAEGILEGEFEIRLLWHTDHELDFAGLLVPLQMDPPTSKMALQDASHSKNWDVQASLTEADGRFVELVPGETVSLSFTAAAAPDQKRSFLLLADGHYVAAQETEEHPPVPTAYRLYPCRPNPFNPTTTISFDLPEQAYVTLNVYSVDGRLIRTLTDREFPAGRHNVRWDGRDRGGREVSSGVYFYKLRTPLGTETRKMTLLK